MPAGRNDPCPCGSGLKYKKCHLPLDEAARLVLEEASSPLHELEGRFIDRVLRWSIDRFGNETNPDALERSFPDVASGGMQLLAPWSSITTPSKA